VTFPVIETQSMKMAFVWSMTPCSQVYI